MPADGTDKSENEMPSWAAKVGSENRRMEPNASADRWRLFLFSHKRATHNKRYAIAMLTKNSYYGAVAPFWS